MSVNKVILLGNVGRDPEVRYFEGGEAVASFSLATTDRGFTSKSGVQVPDRTEWHNVVAWRGLAQLAENYIRKGTQIYVEGKLRTRTYDDQSGVKQYRTEVYADVIQLLGKRDSEKSPLESTAQSTPMLGDQSAVRPTPQGIVQTNEVNDIPF